MFEAKSMYLGGVIINAANADYNYYKDYGLKCPVCGEEVFLKAKNRSENSPRPHFSHRRYSENTSKKCSQRIIQSTNARSKLPLLTWEGRGQRRELYQQHLLDIISHSFKDFYDKFQEAKSLYEYNEDFILRYCYLFRQNKAELICKITIEENLTVENINQLSVAKEVIDYLCQEESLSLLEEIMIYAIFKLYDNNYSLKHIIFEVKNILINTNWIIFLEDSSKINDRKKK